MEGRYVNGGEWKEGNLLASGRTKEELDAIKWD